MDESFVGHPLVVLLIVALLCVLGIFAWRLSARLVKKSQRARGDLSGSAPVADRPLRPTLEAVRAGQDG